MSKAYNDVINSGFVLLIGVALGVGIAVWAQSYVGRGTEAPVPIPVERRCSNGIDEIVVDTVWVVPGTKALSFPHCPPGYGYRFHEQATAPES